MSIESPELARGIRAGDPGAQRVVVETYLPQILRASRAAGLDGAAAEDVAQATFPTFFGKAPTDEIEALVDRRFGERGDWTNPPRDIETVLEGAEIACT